MVPYSIIGYQNFIFIRFIKFRKFGMYQNYIDEFITEIASNFLNIEQIKKLIKALRLVIQISFVSHFLANLWILIGLYGLTENGSGWIQTAIESNL